MREIASPMRDFTKNIACMSSYRMTKRIMVIVGIFVFCNSIQVLNYVVQFSLLESIADLLLTINSSINGIVYGIFSKSFRETFLSCNSSNRTSTTLDEAVTNRRRQNSVSNSQITINKIESSTMLEMK